MRSWDSTDPWDEPLASWEGTAVTAGYDMWVSFGGQWIPISLEDVIEGPMEDLTSFTATPTADTISLVWSPSVTGATITRNGVSIATGISGTTYTDSGLDPATQYVYELTSDGYRGSVTATTAALQPLTSFTATPTKDTVTLDWTPSVTGATITRNGTSIVTGHSGTTYLDTGLTPETQYTYDLTSEEYAGTVTTSTSAAATACEFPGAVDALYHFHVGSTPCPKTVADYPVGSTITLDLTDWGIATPLTMVVASIQGCVPLDIGGRPLIVPNHGTRSNAAFVFSPWSGTTQEFRARYVSTFNTDMGDVGPALYHDPSRGDVGYGFALYDPDTPVNGMGTGLPGFIPSPDDLGDKYVATYLSAVAPGWGLVPTASDLDTFFMGGHVFVEVGNSTYSGSYEISFGFTYEYTTLGLESSFEAAYWDNAIGSEYLRAITPVMQNVQALYPSNAVVGGVAGTGAMPMARSYNAHNYGWYTLLAMLIVYSDAADQKPWAFQAYTGYVGNPDETPSWAAASAFMHTKFPLYNFWEDGYGTFVNYENAPTP